MITITDSTVFNVGTQTLVNAVNTVGTMGKGIALEFALRYPDMNEEYERKCEAGVIQPGRVDYYEEQDGTIIVNFPTKKHYAHPSRIEYIEDGLIDFVKTYKEHGVTSAAFPKLGCSNGGLRWEVVKPLMIEYLDPLEIMIFICEGSKKEAEGAEAIMVDEYNKFIKGQRTVNIKLTEKQVEALYNFGQISHFYQLRDIEGAKSAYKKLFHEFYPQVTGQMSLW